MEDESVVWTCSGCRESIDPSAEVVETVERQPVETTGIVESQHVVTVFHYAHAGHEGPDISRGYHKSGSGTLRDLRAKRRASPGS